MKIIYVTANLPFRSSEPFIIPEILELKRLGNEIQIVPMYSKSKVLNNNALPLINYTISASKLSFFILGSFICSIILHPITFVKVLLLLLLKSRSLKILMKNLIILPKGIWFSKIVKKWNPDIIHIHWASVSSTMGWIAHMYTKVPYIITCHRWDIYENNLLKIKAENALFMRSINKQGADSIKRITQNNELKLYVIPMGVNITTNSIIKPKNNTIRIITAANLIEVKGHKYLIEAISILIKRNVNVMLDIIGTGDLKEALKSQVENLNLGRIINFHGYISNDEILIKMKSGYWDVMVLPSIETESGAFEGIPVSLMEAMSHNIPCISTKTGGIPELLDNDCGILVDQKDSEQLAGAIEKLEKNPKLRIELGEKGNEKLRKNFDVVKTTNKLLTLINKELQKQL